MREIYQKTNLVSGGLEIVQYLGLMDFLKRVNGLKFQNNLVLNHNISKVFSGGGPIELDSLGVE